MDNRPSTTILLSNAPHSVEPRGFRIRRAIFEQKIVVLCDILQNLSMRPGKISLQHWEH